MKTIRATYASIPAFFKWMFALFVFILIAKSYGKN